MGRVTKRWFVARRRDSRNRRPVAGSVMSQAASSRTVDDCILPGHVWPVRVECPSVSRETSAETGGGEPQRFEALRASRGVVGSTLEPAVWSAFHVKQVGTGLASARPRVDQKGDKVSRETRDVRHTWIARRRGRDVAPGRPQVGRCLDLVAKCLTPLRRFPRTTLVSGPGCWQAERCSTRLGRSGPDGSGPVLSGTV